MNTRLWLRMAATPDRYDCAEFTKEKKCLKYCRNSFCASDTKNFCHLFSLSLSSNGFSDRLVDFRIRFSILPLRLFKLVRPVRQWLKPKQNMCRLQRVQNKWKSTRSNGTITLNGWRSTKYDWKTQRDREAKKKKKESRFFWHFSVAKKKTTLHRAQLEIVFFRLFYCSIQMDWNCHWLNTE